MRVELARMITIGLSWAGMSKAEDEENQIEARSGWPTQNSRYYYGKVR